MERSARRLAKWIIARIGLVLAPMTLPACTSEAHSNQSSECVRAPLVYGDDDRREIWESDAFWRDLAMHFVVAIADAWVVESLHSGQLSVSDLAAQHTQQLCADERYADQPSLAVCSGVLIASDLVLTAAHCVDRVMDCEALVYLTQFANRQDGPWRSLQPELMRRCKSISRIDSSKDQVGTARDVALVRLDSGFDVPGEWFGIRADNPKVREHVIAIGHPSGLPLKFDDGGTILSAPHAADGYVTSDIDAFQGSSGGPVFDVQGALLGVVLGGQPDYDYDRNGDCLRPTVVGRAQSGSAERIAPVNGALKQLCGSGEQVACELQQSAAILAPEDPTGCGTER